MSITTGSQKLALTKRLYERGYNKQEVIGLYRFLDWLLALPEELAAEFDDKLSEYEEERKMQYVTSIERRGIEKGLQQGRQEGLQMGAAEITLRQLQRRFGALEAAAQAHIRALPLEQLEELSEALLDFAALSDLEVWLQQHPLPSSSTSGPSAAGETRNGPARES
jgi:flagellar biosynthesis/type III secretory pathway protein FliH